MTQGAAHDGPQPLHQEQHRQDETLYFVDSALVRTHFCVHCSCLAHAIAFTRLWLGCTPCDQDLSGKAIPNQLHMKSLVKSFSLALLCPTW